MAGADTMTESETREFKKSLAELKEGLISISAMLNKHGTGELWFGIRNDGTPAGLDINEKTLRDISQAIAAHIEPRIYPHVTREAVGVVGCIKVTCEGSDAPYYAYGRTYMRVADEDRQLTPKELERLILRKHDERHHWDDQPCHRTVADLNRTTLRAFVKRAGLTWDTPANALDKLGLLRKGKLVNAASLFFAKEPPLELRCAVFATTDSATIIDRHDFRGDILELIEEAQKYILKNIHIGMRLEGLYRKDVPEISVEALREAIINAFCHRDYRDPEYIQVAIFKDRVEIRNPGCLYGGLTLEDLRHGHVSRRRNPLIADLFRRIEMVEAWGRGMPLIRKNAPSVTFREVAGVFIVGFARPSFQIQPEVSEKRRENTEGKHGAGEKGPLVASEKMSEKMSEKILAILTEKPKASIADMARTTGVTTRTIERNLQKLIASNRLRRVGPDKGGHWEVLSAPDAKRRGGDHGG
jgi:ATP-dependent DNA helicase RecG